jgi:hypothetical protein
MAESLKFLKGMFKDSGRIDQPDNTYRDALNLIIDDKKGVVSNEYGTEEIGKFIYNYYINGDVNGVLQEVQLLPIGTIKLNDNSIIVFAHTTDSYYVEEPGFSSIILTNYSAIFKVSPNSKTVTLLYITLGPVTEQPYIYKPLSQNHLNFNSKHPVTGEYRLSPNGDILIYFTDNNYEILQDAKTGVEYVKSYNPPRVFNVSKQERSLSIASNPSILYGDNTKECILLNVFMETPKIPELQSIQILSGGALEVGAYYLGLAYADEDLTETNVVTVFNPVYIVPNPEQTVPYEMISGAPVGTQTNKIIIWDLGVSVKYTQYKYLIPYVIKYSGNSLLAYKLNPIETGPNGKIIYTGLEKVQGAAPSDVILDKVKYLAAKSITQLDNKLYMANLVGRKDIGYQRFANNIKLNTIIREIQLFDPRYYDIFNLNEGYAKMVFPDQPAFSNNDRLSATAAWPKFGWLTTREGLVDSYINDVIKPIQNQNSGAQSDVSTNGYRNPYINTFLKGYRRGEVYAFYISFVLKDGSETYAYHIPGRRYIGSEEILQLSGNINVGPGDDPIVFRSQEIYSSDYTGYLYQYLDTSLEFPSEVGIAGLQKTTGFWQNLNEIYPNTEDFDIWDVDSSGNGYLNSGIFSNRSALVRHHKMPSNHNSSRSYLKSNVDFTSPTQNPDQGLDLSRKSVAFKEQVRILGIQLSNIKIPKFILRQIQGYKVYYAKRTQGNKTILGQSGAHPATPYLAANLNNTRSKASAGPFYNIWLLEGHHKTGGVHTRNALWVPTVPAGTIQRPGQYLAQPVIKFHDFNLLRTKSSLASATHIDVQYIVTMQNWTGGYKGARRVEPPGTASTVPTLPNGTRITFYTSLRSGSGDDEYAWVHPDLGNTTNFNATPDSTFYDILGPQILWGNVYIGAMYNTPGRANIDIGVRSRSTEDGTSPWGIDQGILYNDNGFIIIPKQEQLLNHYQSIFMLDADSATYIDGLKILKSTPGGSYKGASYLFNAYGESGIVLGLVSGLPALGGYKGHRWSYWGLLELAWQIRNTGSNFNSTPDPIDPGIDLQDFYLELQHFPYVGIDPSTRNLESLKKIIDALIPNSLDELPQLFSAGIVTSLTPYPPAIGVNPTGRPNVYLVNLCAKKTDVFAPFDEQQLVWTGYYEEVNVNNFDTGIGGNLGYSFYSGASSGEIYGGDTYICRYSYRTTSANFGLAHFAKGKNSLNLTGITNDFIYGDIPFDTTTGTTGVPPGEVFNVLNFGSATFTENTIDITASEAAAGDASTNNWSLGSVDPFTTVYQFLVESDDNINYRHAGDPIKGIGESSSMYFDKYVAAEVLWRSPLFDLTKMDNILYNDHYSAVQDLRVTIPYPKKDVSTYLFPNRVIRSQTQDGTFADQYRYLLAFDYKDFAVNKGQITNIFNLNALLYIHTENSLFRTKGKQNLELSDSTQAYIGSGNIFAQEPDEFVQSTEGYLGLQNKFGAIVTKDGYIFVARRARKIFMVSDKISDLTEIGLNSWARENIPFVLESYGWDADIDSSLSDSPTYIFGFIISYDPLFKRSIITKRELIPTDSFIYGYNTGQIVYDTTSNWFTTIDGVSLGRIADGQYFIESGWTISFSHTLSIWASRHSYTPKMYGYNFDFMYSFRYNTMYEHSDLLNPGNFYGVVYNFEVDCIFNGEVKKSQQGVISTKDLSKLYSSFAYTADVYKKDDISSLPYQKFDPGFTSYYVYNTTQISGEEQILYLNNIRKVDSEWTINNFRDVSYIVYNSTLSQNQVGVNGSIYSGSYTHSYTDKMFLSEGVINTSYIDSNKLWYDKKKFVDKFAGIRLIYNNQTRNLINLYGVTAASRVSAR